MVMVDFCEWGEEERGEGAGQGKEETEMIFFSLNPYIVSITPHTPQLPKCLTQVQNKEPFHINPTFNI